MDPDATYNPLDKRHLGKSVVDALLSQPEHSLAEVPSVVGAGIYAIYYRGCHRLYQPLADANRRLGSLPIYVGKAIPKGSRKGASMATTTAGAFLANRIGEHAKSIRDVESLDLSHFAYRCLAVDDIWISLGEALLIERFQPLWNVVVEGFGNHDPGKGRYRGRRPLWDEVHPGRPWAARCAAPTKTLDEIEAAIRKYMERTFADRRVPSAPGNEEFC